MLKHIYRDGYVVFDYKNWKGEQSTRRVLVSGFYWGSTTYHPTDQLILRGFDLDKSQTRDFAVADIINLVVMSEEEN
jgi:predicted DNA-binding transcriptional regulator YafY